MASRSPTKSLRYRRRFAKPGLLSKTQDDAHSVIQCGSSSQVPRLAYAVTPPVPVAYPTIRLAQVLPFLSPHWFTYAPEEIKEGL